MIARGKKLLSLFLIFSLIMLSVNLYAKERRGAKLIATKKNGQEIKGELIAVKPNSLLLLDTGGRDVSVDIADIRVITIVKKSKWLLGAGLGLLIGGVIGTIIGGSGIGGSWGRFGLGSLGAFLGGAVGEAAGKDEKIHIEAMLDSEIQKTMDKLRKKARIRDYK